MYTAPPLAPTLLERFTRSPSKGYPREWTEAHAIEFYYETPRKIDALVQCATLFSTYPAVAASAAFARVTFARMSEARTVDGSDANEILIGMTNTSGNDPRSWIRLDCPGIMAISGT